MKVLLRNPNAATRRARTLAAVGAAIAVGTTGLMVLAVGTAAADEPGRCTEAVKVRAEPDLTAPVVGVCPAGTAVQVGEIREGYLYLTDYAGWVAWEYVMISEPSGPAEPAGAAPTDAEPSGAEPADAAPTDQVSAPTTEPTTAATTATGPGSSSAVDTAGEDPAYRASTPSTTPTADPTPGRA